MRSIRCDKSVLILILIAMTALPIPLTGCDTWVALADAVRGGFVILAKNSDRPLFDSQPLVFHPAEKWEEDAVIDLGRLKIAQVPETFATLGSSPYWCWGYEEGINQHSVAIGNEGVFSRDLARALQDQAAGTPQTPGPTGMDLIRIGLERGATAREAMRAITAVLEEHGQFGSGSPTQGGEGAYDNSYLIADPSEAWILETAGRRWVARRISRGVASISNTLSIETEWDMASKDLKAHAETQGWWSEASGDPFHFANVYNDDSPVRRAVGRRACVRSARSLELLMEKKGEITPRWMMRIARDRASTPSLDLDQTASSCVAVLPKPAGGLPVFWWTPGPPSSGCYVPFFVHGSRLPDIVSRAGSHGRRIVPPSKAERDRYSDESFWWLFRRLADLTNRDRDNHLPVVRAAFDPLEQGFADALPDVLREAADRIAEGGTHEAAALLDGFSAECLARVESTVRQLVARFSKESEAALAASGASLAEFEGRYNANFSTFQDVPFTVKSIDGWLTIDVPGQQVFQLNPPGDDGLWRFVISPQLAAVFLRDDTGRVVAMKLHQPGGVILELPRLGIETPPRIPLEELKKYQGAYYGEKLDETLEITLKNNALALKIPGKKIYELRLPDQNGRWVFRVYSGAGVEFEEDGEGKIIGFTFFEGKASLRYVRTADRKQENR